MTIFFKTETTGVVIVIKMYTHKTLRAVDLGPTKSLALRKTCNVLCFWVVKATFRAQQISIARSTVLQHDSSWLLLLSCYAMSWYCF
jgi:hypothetical protein